MFITGDNLMYPGKCGFPAFLGKWAYSLGEFAPT